MRVASACLVLLLLSGCAVVPPSAAPTSASAAAPTAERVAAESERLNAWFEARYEEALRFSPMQLTFLGRKELYDRFDDLSDAAADRQLEWQRVSVAQMQSAFDYALLSDETKRSYDLWKYQYEQALAAVPFRRNQYAFDQMNGLQSFLPTFLISFHAVDDESDMRAYIARVGEVPRVIDQLLAHAKASVAYGVRPPRFAYEGVVEQAQKVIAGAPFDKGADSALWADMQRKIDALVAKGTLTPGRAAALKAESRTALLTRFLPAYKTLIAWVRADLPNTTAQAQGVGAQPNGAAYYQHQLAQQTTTALTAAEIHEIGLREVTRLRAEMIALKDRTGFKGDLPAFFKFLGSDPRFRFPNTDAGRQGYLDAATAAIDNIKKELPNWFGLLPRADVVVKRVEPFREQDGAAQHYFPGTPDGARPGIYYAHLSDMGAMPKTELEVIAYHEALPGHHMQISIAQELEGIPTFRRQAGFTAYVEGWALYAEWLAKQMPGTYQDPYSDFGRLTSEMWRAVRLVVDTGLHTMNWSQEQAIAYFTANTAVPLAAVRSEVQRYLVMPGQATSYKIGMLKIQELRAQAESELGERFDIRAFHDVVLGGGAMPLELLQRRVEGWIAERKRG